MLFACYEELGFITIQFYWLKKSNEKLLSCLLFSCRPHISHGCFQLGDVLNGNRIFITSGSCPNGNPSGGVWFTVRVEVTSGKSVSIYLNNDLVTSLTAHFDTRGHGGVLVANGYSNVIQFRNICIIKTN